MCNWSTVAHEVNVKPAKCITHVWRNPFLPSNTGHHTASNNQRRLQVSDESITDPDEDGIAIVDSNMDGMVNQRVSSIKRNDQRMDRVQLSKSVLYDAWQSWGWPHIMLFDWRSYSQSINVSLLRRPVPMGVGVPILSVVSSREWKGEVGQGEWGLRMGVGARRVELSRVDCGLGWESKPVYHMGVKPISHYSRNYFNFRSITRVAYASFYYWHFITSIRSNMWFGYLNRSWYPALLHQSCCRVSTPHSRNHFHFWSVPRVTYDVILIGTHLKNFKPIRV